MALYTAVKTFEWFQSCRTQTKDWSNSPTKRKFPAIPRCSSAEYELELAYSILELFPFSFSS